MKIGIDCRRILHKHNETAGVGTYTYNIIKSILDLDKQNNYVLFFYNNKIYFPEFAKYENVEMVYLPRVDDFGRVPFFYNHVYVPYVLKKYKLDLYHNPANIIPLLYNKASVITVHDLAIYKNADWFPGKQSFNLKLLMPYSFKKAKKIIAVSQSTKNDLIELFKIKQQKISVIPEGVEDYKKVKINEDEIKSEIKFNNSYFLFIGTIEPRKNINSLLKAFKEFVEKTNNKKIKLVMAGKKGWKYEQIFKLMSDLDLGDQIKYLGYVSLEEKIYLLKNAFCFIFPSYYEGFGLPVLEAMNLGVPVITSNISSIPEFASHNSLLINPHDYLTITKAMVKIYNDKDLRKKLSEKGKVIADQYNWKKAAQKTIDLYNQTK